MAQPPPPPDAPPLDASFPDGAPSAAPAPTKDGQELVQEQDDHEQDLGPEQQLRLEEQEHQQQQERREQQQQQQHHHHHHQHHHQERRHHPPPSLRDIITAPTAPSATTSAASASSVSTTNAATSSSIASTTPTVSSASSSYPSVLLSPGSGRDSATPTGNLHHYLPSPGPPPPTPSTPAPAPGYLSNGQLDRNSPASASATSPAPAPVTAFPSAPVPAPAATLPPYSPPPPPATAISTNGNGDGKGTGNGDPASSAAPAPMSNAPPPPGYPRQHPQHVGYAGQPPYAPPSTMNPPYAYPLTASQAPDPYRTSQPMAPNPALALPSMRSLDPLQQQQQAQQSMPMNPPMPGYYAPPLPYGIHPNMRFDMIQDPRVAMSGGRHKKEIKRRTKTGCLTCRKRRIKCDETHPTCNNCRKSKRECAGYDPIFKQAQQQGVTATPLQPAPNHPSPGPPTPLSATASVSTYGSQPSVVPSSYSSSPQAHPSYDSGLASGVDYPAALDPSLDPSVTSSASHHHHHHHQPHHAHHLHAVSSSTNPVHYRGGSSRFSYPSSQSSSAPKTAGLTYSSPLAKQMKVDELVALGGPAPPPRSAPPGRETLDEITKIYYDIYVPGLTSFFETPWFNFKPDRPPTAANASSSDSNASASPNNSISLFYQNKGLIDLLASFLDAISQIKTTDKGQMTNTGNLETRVVWGLASLANSAPALSASSPQPAAELKPPENGSESRSRLIVFEALLAGTYFTSNPCAPPPRTGDPHRIREFEFWWYLAEYLRLGPSGGAGEQQQGAAPSPQREAALTRIRSLLDGRENRDVLYSIAVLRELSPRFQPGYEAQVPKHLDESEPRNRLAVAARFIRDEALTTGGTTNVVRRFAELAIKAFISPGVNVARRP